MHVIARYSLLSVVGAGFFVSAPIAVWLVVDSMTPMNRDTEIVTLDIDTESIAPLVILEAPAPVVDVVSEGPLNLHSLAQNARIVPAYQGGRVIGFKLFSIRPGSDFALAGLQNGDTVTRINGIEITSTERAMEAYARAHDGLIVVDFLRRGQRGTLTHHVPSP